MSGFRATRRLVALAGAMAIVGIIALWTRNWVPAVALLPCIGVLGWAFVETLLPLPKAASRSVHDMLLGDTTTVELRVDRVPLPGNLSLVDGIPEGVRAVPGAHVPFDRVGRRLRATYDIEATRRGLHVFGDAWVARVSALGLFQRWCRLPAPASVTVQPGTAKQHRVRVRARQPGHAGVATTLTRRSGDEFFALREYQPGDPLADVNWKATARSGRLITNEFSPDEPPRYLIYLDTRGFGREAGQADVFERTLEAGAILADALLEQRAHVGLVLLSYWSHYIVPGHGAKQGQRLRRMIVDCEAGAEAPIEELVRAGAPHLPARADAVLLTSNAYDPSLREALRFLKARHGRVHLLAPAFPEPRGEARLAERTAGALLNTELEIALEPLVGMADRAVLWREDEHLNVVLTRLGMQGRRR